MTNKYPETVMYEIERYEYLLQTLDKYETAVARLKTKIYEQRNRVNEVIQTRSQNEHKAIIIHFNEYETKERCLVTLEESGVREKIASGPLRSL